MKIRIQKISHTVHALILGIDPSRFRKLKLRASGSVQGVVYETFDRMDGSCLLPERRFLGVAVAEHGRAGENRESGDGQNEVH